MNDYFTRLKITNIEALGALFKTRLAQDKIKYMLTVNGPQLLKKHTFPLEVFNKDGFSNPLGAVIRSNEVTVERAMNPQVVGKPIRAYWQIFDTTLPSRMEFDKDLGFIDKGQRIWFGNAQTFFKTIPLVQISGTWNEATIKPYFAGATGRINQGEVKPTIVQFNRKELGVFNINRISVVNGKTYTVDSAGNPRDDYIHGDAPSQEKLTSAHYNIVERANLRLFRDEPDSMHETRLKALALKADGSDGNAAVQHFIDGSGTDFTYSNGTALAQEMQKTASVKNFIKGLESYLKDKIQEKGTLLSEDPVLSRDLPENVKLPAYKWYSAIGFDEDTSAIIIGGVQAAKVKYSAEFGAEKQLIKVKITHITFYDCFGAGLNDALGGKAIAPGFASFVVLQHYSNANKPNKYVPYTSIVNIEVK